MNRAIGEVDEAKGEGEEAFEEGFEEGAPFWIGVMPHRKPEFCGCKMLQIVGHTSKYYCCMLLCSDHMIYSDIYSHILESTCAGNQHETLRLQK